MEVLAWVLQPWLKLFGLLEQLIWEEEMALVLKRLWAVVLILRIRLVIQQRLNSGKEKILSEFSNLVSKE